MVIAREIVSVAGKNVDDMTREELIEAVKMLGRALEDAHKTYLAMAEVRIDQARANVKW